MKRGLVALLVLMIAAVAGAQGKAPQTLVHVIRGVSYRFTVPEGWSSYPAADGVAFSAPATKIKAPFNFAVVGAAMPSGVDTTEKLVQLLADDEIKNRKPWATVAQKNPANFVGEKGNIIFLMGTEPTKNIKMVTVYLAVPVSSSAGKDVLVFSGDGTFDDFHDLAAQMDVIIDTAQSLGAAPATGAQPAAPGDNSGSFGEASEQPAAPSVTGPGRGIDAEVADPFWGLEVSGLETSWRLKMEGSAYVFMNPDPPASVTIQRIGYDSPAKLKAKELKSARRGRFGEREAWILDGKRDGAPERSFYILDTDHALVVRFASPTFDAALRKHFGDVERAVKIRAARIQVDRVSGTTFELPFGVAVAVLPAPWKLDQARAGAGSAVVFDPDAGVQVELKVRQTEGENDDPFYGDEQKFATTCATSKGSYDDLPVAVLGASDAHRYRCRNGRHANGDPMGALMYRAVATREGKPVHIMVLSFFRTASGESPDRAAADLMQHVRMGGARP